MKPSKSFIVGAVSLLVAGALAVAWVRVSLPDENTVYQQEVATTTETVYTQSTVTVEVVPDWVTTELENLRDSLEDRRADREEEREERRENRPSNADEARDRWCDRRADSGRALPEACN